MFKIIEAKDSRTIGNTIFRLYSYSSLTLIILSSVLITTIDLLICNILVHLFCILICVSESIKKLPGLLFFMFTMLIYVQIPIFYIALNFENFRFDAIIQAPLNNNIYKESIVGGIYFFVFCHLTLIAGLYFGNIMKVKKSINKLFSYSEARVRSKRFLLLIIVGFITFSLALKDIFNIFSSRANVEAKEESFFVLLFNDKMYQLLFPLFFYLLAKDTSTKKNRNVFLLILGLFTVYNFATASKASILIMFSNFFLLPLSLFYLWKKEIYWPSKPIIILGLVISIPLFFISMLERELSGVGIDITSKAFLDEIGWFFANNNLAVISDILFFRLSVNVNNFILLFHHFGENHDPAYAFEFLTYLYKSFINLILPGTPYPESYVLSSQLFPDVIAKVQLMSSMDKAQFLVQANTQPYTLFGVLLIIFGLFLTPIITFILGFIFTLIYKRVNLFWQLLMQFAFFNAIYHSYGFEVALQYILLVLIPSVIIQTIIKFIPMIKFGLNRTIPVKNL